MISDLKLLVLAISRTDKYYKLLGRERQPDIREWMNRFAYELERLISV